MKILCFGDLHLGHGPGYGRTPGDRLNDQQEVLGRIGGLAVEHGVDVILNVGDTIEGPGNPPEQLDIFGAFIEAMHLVGIPIVAITGNGKHDAAMRTVNAVDIFRRIPGITVSSTPQLIDVMGCTIATLPWVHPGRLVAARDGGDRDEINREAAGLLVATARGLRAQITDGRPAILALHGSVSGASLPAGLPVDDLKEPVLPIEDIEALGFDVVVMGHIHLPQVIPNWGNNSIFYTGSPLPLNFGETGYQHGVYLVDIDGEVGAPSITFLPIDSPPFVTIDVDVTAVEGELGHAHNAIIDAIDAADVSGAIVRLRYRATADQQRRIYVDVLRACVLEDGARVVKIEPEIVREDRSRVDGVNEDLAPLDAYDLWAAANEIAPELAARARARMTEHLEAVA